MHNLNILVLGPESFISTINELKKHFNFSLIVNQKDLFNKKEVKFDGLICHEKSLNDKNIKKILDCNDYFKVLVAKNDRQNLKIFNNTLKLPFTIKEINNLVENSAAKKVFNKNSSIKVKAYQLNKNEKKLIKDGKFVTLTEKEVNLLELFLNSKNPISKNDILSLVWHYSADADTHTVETHIYRLRKKINKIFSDDKFILNDKDGYFL
tara:strand:+ start:1515 stop:2141 length:627 start_codon:yes stop_codon:yes gene_type:complete